MRTSLTGARLVRVSGHSDDDRGQLGRRRCDGCAHPPGAQHAREVQVSEVTRTLHTAQAQTETSIMRDNKMKPKIDPIGTRDNYFD